MSTTRRYRSFPQAQPYRPSVGDRVWVFAQVLAMIFTAFLLFTAIWVWILAVASAS
jgi:hypothetical protein